ncbi:hypothetical protein GCM10007425_08550 [Lysinibacillus alkalisoli]|uniref:YqkK n=1 Tax=Lysinibacillus alkalisoli TaxID=1911548 RepID=A0A917LEN3_9BACI|nr:hypothetical protein [Lysinibacillus alkalisoli]GGG16478.1 hypothetical protein GCM10007425_08550 [Lysinibacillus alkalisoli]
MANSAAKKKRLALLRQTGKDVTNARNYNTFSTHERLTKTKKEHMTQCQNKHKRHTHHYEMDGDAFYLYYISYFI